MKIYNITVSEDYYFDILFNNKDFSHILWSNGDTFINIGSTKCIRAGSIHKDNYRVDIFIPLNIWENMRDKVQKLINEK